MRKKALLVGAAASFEGPWVNLEEGEWLVEPPPASPGQVLLESNVRVSTDNGRFELTGPARVRGRVLAEYSGTGVHLDARMMS